MNKQWKTTIYLSEEKVPHTIYAETHEALNEATIALLCELKPDRMRSGQAFYRKENGHWIPRVFSSYTDIDAEAYRSFCRRGLDIEQGPEYIDHGFVDGKFRLEYVRTVAKYHDIEGVNKMLKRGWHILELEQQDVEPNMTTTYYILGHVEENAK